MKQNRKESMLVRIILNKTVLLHDNKRGTTRAVSCPLRVLSWGGGVSLSRRKDVPLSWSSLGDGGTPVLGPAWGTPYSIPQRNDLGRETRGYALPPRKPSPFLRNVSGNQMVNVDVCSMMFVFYFIMTDTHSGIMRIWTVSKTSPVENYKLKRTGFHALHIFCPTDSLATNSSSSELLPKKSSSR